MQLVAFCQGATSDNPNGDPLAVEFRQEDTVVAEQTMSVGEAFTAEVPVGQIDFYVGDVFRGTVNEGMATDGPYHSPEPGEVNYLRSPEGCPESPPPWSSD